MQIVKRSTATVAACPNETQNPPYRKYKMTRLLALSVYLSCVIYLVAFAVSISMHLNKSEITFTIHWVLFGLIAPIWWLLSSRAKSIGLSLSKKEITGARSALSITIIFAILIMIISAMFYNCCVVKSRTPYMPAQTSGGTK